MIILLILIKKIIIFLKIYTKKILDEKLFKVIPVNEMQGTIIFENFNYEKKWFFKKNTPF